MIPEIGHFALILALLIALLQGVLPIVGAARGIGPWMDLARPAAKAQAMFVTLAFGCLMWSFYVSDFSVQNVATNSNSLLPWYYKLSATWGSHEGSILLWTLMLAWWTSLVAFFSRHLPREMVARVIGTLGLVSAGFILFTLTTSDPFDRLFPAAPEGRDLNPLLQDPGMIFHPPMLYMGYVGFAVPFAFAIAALMGGRLDAAWARWTRPWTTMAWVFLTLGIALGSWWAYYELGWGGWWFWDPVENASFMPWLTGTALVHSLAVTEKRGSFKTWTVLLAIITFSMSLLGTFLVRSGVLTSVHAFATDPERGVFILGFLIFVIGSSLLLFAWRAPKVGLGGKFANVSRESMLLMNNVLLVVAMGAVFLGTMYPLFLDAIAGTKISVGPPYFDAVFAPLMAPLVFLMGVGPLSRWKEAKIPDLATRLRWAAVVAVVTAVLVPVVLGRWSWIVSGGLLLAFWIVASAVVNVREHIRNVRGSLLTRLASQPRAFWGMNLAHLGVAIFIIGVTLVKGYETERDVRMAVGDVVSVGGFTFKFEGVQEVQGPNYVAARGTFDVSKNGRFIEKLYPEKRSYLSNRAMPMTEAAIDSSIIGDIYVSLGEPVGGDAWTVRAYYKPFVTWIWWGCVAMALGGLLALSDRRYRFARRREASAAKPAVTA